MGVKTRLKNSPFSPLLVYLKYFINRYFIKKAFSSFQLSKDIKLEYIDDGITFFGYYNISPSNNEGDVLYLKVTQEDVRGSICEPAFIMLKKKDSSVVKIGETNSWNWQQGCFLQWHPLNRNQIIYNDYDAENDIYVSKIINKSGSVIKIYKMPVNNVSKCGKYALALNYDRLAKMRPDYGYFNRKEFVLPSDEEDGIWKINLTSGSIDLIITLDQLKKLKYVPSMDKAIHKVNHIDISPSGNRFMFLHRWIGANGRFMRLITANSDGSDIFILNGDVMTSHSCWLNDEEILSFCEYNGIRGYFKFIDKTNKAKLFSTQFPKIDGHPSKSPDGKYIVLDSYPDKSRFSSLYLYNIAKDKFYILGRFYQPLRYKKEIRIDLHPKWGADSTSIYFESGHKSCRKLYKLVLPAYL